jgi:hypothetical protein
LEEDRKASKKKNRASPGTVDTRPPVPGIAWILEKKYFSSWISDIVKIFFINMQDI